MTSYIQWTSPSEKVRIDFYRHNHYAIVYQQNIHGRFLSIGTVSEEQMILKGKSGSVAVSKLLSKDKKDLFNDLKNKNITVEELDRDALFNLSIIIHSLPQCRNITVEKLDRDALFDLSPPLPSSMHLKRRHSI